MYGNLRRILSCVDVTTANYGNLRWEIYDNFFYANEQKMYNNLS